MPEPAADTTTMTLDEARDRMLDAAALHVPFDGWSTATLRAAQRDAGVSSELSAAAFPRGAVDLALAFHEAGDQAMLRRLRTENLGALRFRDKIATAVRYRLEAIEDRELVRRASALFALPQYAADGTRAVWQTADGIWAARGDTSDDINWYTKRATLSGVYSATVLYWLGDDSWEAQGTRAFIDRRIGDVMQIEKAKAQINDSAILKPLTTPFQRFASMVKAPRPRDTSDLPGRWTEAS